LSREFGLNGRKKGSSGNQRPAIDYDMLVRHASTGPRCWGNRGGRSGDVCPMTWAKKIFAVYDPEGSRQVRKGRAAKSISQFNRMERGPWPKIALSTQSPKKQKEPQRLLKRMGMSNRGGNLGRGHRSPNISRGKRKRKGPCSAE